MTRSKVRRIARAKVRAKQHQAHYIKTTYKLPWSKRRVSRDEYMADRKQMFSPIWDVVQ